MTYRENAALGPPCPRCTAPLFAGKVGELDALGCGGCGGLWLDNAGTTIVLGRYSVDAANLASIVDRKAARPESTSPFAAAEGGCPVCKTPLQPVAHEGVRLDFCADHGTFLDRGELQRILERAAPAALMPMPVVPRGPTLEEIRTTVRHEAHWQKDPLGTALTDWMTGGKDWVNGWRR